MQSGKAGHQEYRDVTFNPHNNLMSVQLERMFALKDNLFGMLDLI